MFTVHPCPQWDYRTHAQYTALMPVRAAQLKDTLHADAKISAATAIDTRQAHQQLFSGLTPRGYDYYAGHYRGEDFPCLKTCLAYIPGELMVGELPYRVALRMQRLSSFMRDIITTLDKEEAPITTKEELQRLVVFTSRSIVDFLTIHPYMNGNGHAARTIMCAIMSHYGLPSAWQIDLRPPDSEYITLISQHRNGNPEPLQAYILERLISN
jgi:fido (protein-threonine AMPylation protein)